MLQTSSDVLLFRELNERYESRRFEPPSTSCAAFVVSVVELLPVTASWPPIRAFCPTLIVDLNDPTSATNDSVTVLLERTMPILAFGAENPDIL